MVDNIRGPIVDLANDVEKDTLLSVKSTVLFGSPT
jgi:hypothetical protein